MTDHPITPPPELVREWAKGCSPYDVPADHIATKAARWGADTELEACCKWMDNHLFSSPSTPLCAARRPKPPSLKEQALALLQPGEPRLFNSDMQNIVRRALEQLDD